MGCSSKRDNGEGVQGGSKCDNGRVLSGEKLNL